MSARGSWLADLPDAVWALDEALNIIYANRGLSDEPGSSLVGKHVHAAVPRDSHRAFEKQLRAALKTKSTTRLSMAVASGARFDTRISPVSDPRDGAFVLVSSVATADASQTDEALRQTEAQLEHALRASRMGTWTWDLLRGQLHWDDRLCEIFGVPHGTAPRSEEEFLTYIHPDDRTSVMAQIGLDKTTGAYQDIVHRVLRPSGEMRHILSRGGAIRDVHGAVIGMRGGVFDITEQKRIEEELRQTQKMRAVGQLTAGIAHNFNNLLGIMLPNVELCKRHASPQQTVRLMDIEHAVMRAADLVDKLSVFSRPSRSHVRHAVDLGRVAEKTLQICRATFSRSIALHLTVEPNLPAVLANEGDLDEVLLNICLNARDAVLACRDREARITFSVGRVGPDRLGIGIRDNGVGMDEQVAARIFEPFFTTKDVGRGTGLGLATAYAIISDHHGEIKCESTPDRGTTFTVQLPIAPPGAETIAAPALPPPPPRAHGETILVVDDEAAVRRVVRDVLESAGFAVQEADNGRTALELVDSSPTSIALMVLDRAMPVLSGDQVLRTLESRGMPFPVLYVTGYAARGVALPPKVTLLAKPLSSVTLLQAVHAHLKRA
jgi:PAS domain S-box-containing protein